MTDRTKKIVKMFASRDTQQLQTALDEIAGLSDLLSTEKMELASGLAALFYREHTDRKDPMNGIMENAEKAMASLGMDVVDIILGHIVEADLEAVEHFARVIGNIESSIDAVLAKLDEHKDGQYAVTNLLLAIESFKDKDAIKAIDKILLFTKSDNPQVKAAAISCIGKTCRAVDTNDISQDLKNKMFDHCFAALSDPKALVRLRVVKALGEMVRYSYLDPDQVNKAHKAFRAILGMDDYEWDVAYIVRNEAEHYLHLCRSGGNNGYKSAANVDGFKQDFRVISKRELCPNTYHFRINAPLIARKIQAGQFIIVRPHPHSERIPLSICGWDRKQGYIEIIIMSAGRTSTESTNKEVGDCFQDIVGPLGQRSHVTKYDGTCVVIGGGYGTGAIIPTARDLKKLGNRVIGIVGARSKNLLIMVDELRDACDEVYTTTNDGSDGIEGFVTHALEKIIEKEKVSTTLSVGPVPMMIAVSKMTQEKGIECWVSLNAIMVDGTGMCGACRVSVDGKTRFACFHGPDFDGHKVDFDQLVKRQRMFVDKEKIALEALKD